MSPDPSAPASPPPLRIGILGAGQMGAAAAVVFRRAGHEVRLWARNPAKHAQIEQTTLATETFLNEHFGPAQSSAGTLALESSLQVVDETSEAILECVAEDMNQKTALLRQLTSSRDRNALVMTCTSALCITDMARGSGLEGILVGAHFWNPPHLIPVVEIIPGEGTPEAQVARAVALMQQAGKIPVRCKDVPGFIGNRLQHAMWREALALVDAGVCSAEDVDRVVKWTFALRLPALGPFENMDVVGLPLVNSIESYLFPHLATDQQPAQALQQRLQDGQTGMSTGKGFYDWSQRDAAAVVGLRDRQVVQQLKFLQQAGAFDEKA